MPKYTTPYGYEYEYKELTPQEGKALVERFHGKQLVEFQVFCNELVSDPYLLNNGQVVNIYLNSASLYQSKKDFHCTQYSSSTPFTTKQILKDGPFQKIEYLPDGDKVFYTRLRKVDGEILRDVLPPMDNGPFPYASNYLLFLNANSEVLEYRKPYDDYNLYRNKEDHQKCYDKIKLRKTIFDSNLPRFIAVRMIGRNPFGKDFINHVDELAASLPGLLNVKEPEAIFNYKFNTLRKIERILYSNLITDTFSDQIFLPLYAYYGKTFIKKNQQYNTDWVLKQDNLYKTWVPDIQLNGHHLEIYHDILKMLDPEADRHISFHNILMKR